MMQLAHPYLKNIPGLKFYKTLGTGAGNGFRPQPDFSTYGFLGVWEKEKDAEHFLKNSELFIKYRKHSDEIFTVFMKNIRVHGSWSGANPFVPEKDIPKGELLAVITRASIARKHLIKFWKKVPAVSAPLKEQKGLILSVGIGEWPLSQMATFSIWENESAMKSYAYQRPEHLEAIKLTRKLNWYTEEMFARFRPYRSEGTWGRKILF